MAEKKKNKTGCLVAAFIWIVVVGAFAVATKMFLLPYFQDQEIDETGSESRYKYKVAIGADSFSGYSILRSPAMASILKDQGVKLTVEDDQADVESRMEKLAKGDLQMAVFTIDSFIATGVAQGEFPATIIMVIDETKGADALVARKSSVASIQALDHAEARVVLTPNSPSEFLARTVKAHFSLPNLPENWIVEADGAEAVYKRFKKDDANKRHAYALWEPYVSMALKEPGAVLLLDSSKLKGYIVDVLVAERGFLRENAKLARTIVESYFRAAYSLNRLPDGMENLVRQDAETLGSPALSAEQARTLVAKIEWKNTRENYDYFGLSGANRATGQHLEDVIGNIIKVLTKTGALASNPLEDKSHTIFYDSILKEMETSGFHPETAGLIEGLGPGTKDLEQARAATALRDLSEAEWAALMPVGELQVKPILFRRGTALINIQSKRDLDDLARSLATWPQYYLRVVGHARAEGDAEANLRLAAQRAEAAAAHLVASGVSDLRILAKGAPPSAGGGSQSVSFELGQVAY